MTNQSSLCTSTSTTDIYQRQIICSDSYSQTPAFENNDDDANYDELCLQEPLIVQQENNIKKSDQTVLCRINCYSIGCWTKPAYLLNN